MIFLKIKWTNFMQNFLFFAEFSARQHLPISETASFLMCSLSIHILFKRKKKWQPGRYSQVGSQSRSLSARSFDPARPVIAPPLLPSSFLPFHLIYAIEHLLLYILTYSLMTLFDAYVITSRQGKTGNGRIGEGRADCLLTVLIAQAKLANSSFHIPLGR